MVEEFPPQPGSHRGTSILRDYAWLVAVIGFILLVGSGLVYTLSRTWDDQAEMGIGLGVVLLLGAVILRPDAVRTALAGRPVKYASNALVMTLAFIGIVGLINFLVFKNHWEYDITANAQFTLSPQTMQVLENLEYPIQVIGFFQTGDLRKDLAEDYLERSQQHTPYLSYEFHDPNVEPGLAERYSLGNYGLLFVNGEKTFEANTVDEQTMTSGLIRVTSDQEKQVYFLTGHGEPSIVDAGPEGYSKVREALEQEDYRVDTLNLAATSELTPSDGTVVIMAGLERELLDVEVEFLQTWTTAGGKLMVLADPLTPAPAQSILAQYGVLMGDDLVADMDNHAMGFAPTSPLIVQYPFHEITQGLDGVLTFFPLARSLQIIEAQGETFNTAPLLTTGPNSWLETNFDQVELNEGVDPQGPAHIGTVTEDLVSGMRLVVVGSADFISNQVVNETANRDLFMNAVNWLTEEEDLISIRPDQGTNLRIFLTPVQHTITIVSSLIVIPIAIFLAGVAMWWKRR